LSEALARAPGRTGPLAGATAVVFSVDDVRAGHQQLVERGMSFTHALVVNFSQLIAPKLGDSRKGGTLAHAIDRVRWHEFK
jgi:hypothetical protein